MKQRIEEDNEHYNLKQQLEEVEELMRTIEKAKQDNDISLEEISEKLEEIKRRKREIRSWRAIAIRRVNRLNKKFKNVENAVQVPITVPLPDDERISLHGRTLVFNERPVHKNFWKSTNSLRQIAMHFLEKKCKDFDICQLLNETGRNFRKKNDRQHVLDFLVRDFFNVLVAKKSMESQPHYRFFFRLRNEPTFARKEVVEAARDISIHTTEHKEVLKQLKRYNGTLMKKKEFNFLKTIISSSPLLLCAPHQSYSSVNTA